MTAAAARLRIDVHVVPRAARSGVGGWRAGALVVRVTAPPVEGAANEAVVKALAAALGIPRGEIVIERGARGRHKVVTVPAAARGRLDALK